MASVFTKILNKEIPGDIIYEDDKFFALLDIRPIRDGHVLVIPKKEIDYIFNLDNHEYLELMEASKKIAHFLEEKLKNKINFSRIAMIVEGLEVPHIHVHLVPILDGEGLVIGRKTNLSLDEVRALLLN